MTQNLDDRYRRLLAEQLVMNEETWSTLVRHGVTEATELRLDFAYAAPDQARAESLESLLKAQTDYDVRIESSRDLLGKGWAVVGSTRPTSVSHEILDQWVDWMVTAGLHQNCEFDGWGTQV
jgi:hypothetical protein